MTEILQLYLISYLDRFLYSYPQPNVDVTPGISKDNIGSTVGSSSKEEKSPVIMTVMPLSETNIRWVDDVIIMMPSILPECSRSIDRCSACIHCYVMFCNVLSSILLHHHYHLLHYSISTLFYPQVPPTSLHFTLLHSILFYLIHFHLLSSFFLLDLSLAY